MKCKRELDFPNYNSACNGKVHDHFRRNIVFGEKFWSWDTFCNSDFKRFLRRQFVNVSNQIQ